MDLSRVDEGRKPPLGGRVRVSTLFGLNIVSKEMPGHKRFPVSALYDQRLYVPMVGVCNR